jgi:ABC-2 type transport system permease protein
MRHAFVDPSAHSAAVYIGGSVPLLIPLGIIAIVFALGLWFFNREAPRIAERL